MSTHSMIGRWNSDGTVDAIYCHFDGYPKHHSPILAQHYATEAQVNALIALGDLEVLAHEGFRRLLDELDGWKPARHYTSRAAFVRSTLKGPAAYLYLWRNGRWSVFGCALHGQWTACAKDVEDCPADNESVTPTQEVEFWFRPECGRDDRMGPEIGPFKSYLQVIYRELTCEPESSTDNVLAWNDAAAYDWFLNRNNPTVKRCTKAVDGKLPWSDLVIYAKVVTTDPA